MKTRFLPFGALLCTLAAALPSRAATFSVTSTRDSGAGSLRDALAQANADPNGGTVNFNFNPPTTKRTITLSSGGLLITNGVSINGPGAALLSVDGNKAINAPVFTISGSTAPFVSISGLTITGGTGANVPSNPALSVGGGINNVGGVLSVADCIVTGNSARSGGGGIATIAAQISLSHCIVSGNSAPVGGGVLSDGSDTRGTLYVQASVISGNSGGGLSLGSPDTIVVSTISGNTGGPGILNTADLNLSNCTVSGNTNDRGSGGGLSNKGRATIAYCTFAGNGAPTTGGIYNGSSSSLSLIDTILSNTGGNLANQDASAVVTDRGFNLASDGANGLLTAPNNKLSVDPRLGPLQYNGSDTPTQALGAGSPALDAGANSGDPIFTDERGVSRPYDDPNIPNASGGDGSDIGSFELAPDTAQNSGFFFVTVPTDHDDGTCGTQDCTLREALKSAKTMGGSQTIFFDERVFVQPQIITLQTDTPLPGIAGTLTLDGPASGVVVAGRMSAPLLTITGTVTMTNIGFSRGKTGLQNDGTLVMNAGSFSGSTTDFVNRGIATLSDTLVQNASTGIQNSGNLTLTRGRFGGITQALVNASGATVAIGDTTMAGNGVGIANGGMLTLNRSTFAGNGDALRNQSGSATLVHCTFVGNTNSVLNTGGAGLSVNRCTVTGNGTGLKSGGGQVLLRNTLLVGNGQNLSATLAGNSLFNITGTTAQGAGLETDSNGFPVLKDNGGPTFTVALVAGSLAINAADPGIQSGTDQRGLPRVVGGRADIGAFEVQTLPSLPKSSAKPSAPSS